MPTYANHTLVTSPVDGENHIVTKWLYPFRRLSSLIMHSVADGIKLHMMIDQYIVFWRNDQSSSKSTTTPIAAECRHRYLHNHYSDGLDVHYERVTGHIHFYHAPMSGPYHPAAKSLSQHTSAAFTECMESRYPFLVTPYHRHFQQSKNPAVLYGNTAGHTQLTTRIITVP